MIAVPAISQPDGRSSHRKPVSQKSKAIRADCAVFAIFPKSPKRCAKLMPIINVTRARPGRLRGKSSKPKKCSRPCSIAPGFKKPIRSRQFGGHRPPLQSWTTKIVLTRRPTCAGILGIIIAQMVIWVAIMDKPAV